MNAKTTLALAVTLLLASNVHAGPQEATRPMDHSKMEMDHVEPITRQLSTTVAYR